MICLVNWLFLCYVVYRGSIRFVTGLEMEVSRMKKIISLVLVFCMLFSLGVSAFADDQGEAPTQTESGGGYLLRLLQDGRRIGRVGRVAAFAGGSAMRQVTV